jgi:hypothetical protein
MTQSIEDDLSIETDVAVVDLETLELAVADAVEQKIEEHAPDALREAMKPKWLHRDQAKDKYGLSNRQLQYLRDQNKVTYSQHGRRIWYLRKSLEDYFEEGRVDANQSE